MPSRSKRDRHAGAHRGAGFALGGWPRHRVRLWVARSRIPPTAEQVRQLFAGWHGELAPCRKFGPSARNYAAARLMAEMGLRINELCYLDWPTYREHMVPLINQAGRTLYWFVEDV